ncbi:hypothetical protein [Uliginosibacterium gangwonense]|uniref:hypothetical protein n=1 Tax=Uliginosibacterium gangwonense TaxID=392736 RepID=UPI000382EC53|nr:hypothetical protein [Uliginosibacterium gangwonense]
MFRSAFALLALMCLIQSAQALEACPAPDLNNQSSSQIAAALKALKPQELKTPPELECQGGFNVNAVAAKSRQLCMFEGKFPLTTAGLLSIAEHDEATTLVYAQKYSAKQHTQIAQTLAKKYPRISAEQYPGKIDADLPVQATDYFSADGIYITLLRPDKKMSPATEGYLSVIIYEKSAHVGMLARVDKECTATTP